MTRALTVLAVQSPAAGELHHPAISVGFNAIAALLERLAQVVEAGCEDSAVERLAGELGALEEEFARTNLAADTGAASMTSGIGLLWSQMAKAFAELRAMTLALKMGAPAADAPKAVK